MQIAVIPVPTRHSREGGNPNPRTRNVGAWGNQAARRFLASCCLQGQTGVWIPAFAGMTAICIKHLKGEGEAKALRGIN